MRLTDSQIEHLLRQQSISDEWPWSTNDERVIDKNVQDIVAETCRKLRLKDKTEYGHYGSGYSSFVDCWFYRPDDDFRTEVSDSFFGLVVLFSRLSPYFVVGQGIKSWNKTSAASYLPHFDFVDKVEHHAVLDMSPQVASILEKRGLKQLHSSDLSTMLPKGVSVPTILTDRVFRHFDALFYWED